MGLFWGGKLHGKKEDKQNIPFDIHYYYSI